MQPLQPDYRDDPKTLAAGLGKLLTPLDPYERIKHLTTAAQIAANALAPLEVKSTRDYLIVWHPKTPPPHKKAINSEPPVPPCPNTESDEVSQ